MRTINRAGLNAMRGCAHIAALSACLALFGVGNASAKTFEVVNTPPPMPPSMQQRETAPLVETRNAVPVTTERKASIGGKPVIVREALGNDAGFVVPDVEEGLVWMPVPTKPMSPGYADARELKLKIRELASQLIANMPSTMRGTVALPTSFVNQENFSQSSPLGRFIAEQFYYECNQRNFPVKEYRMATAVSIKEDGEFLLSRSAKSIPASTGGTVFVAGTYFVDRQAVFVNARLLRGDGTILRTGQIILPNSSITRRMLAGSGKTLRGGSLPIRDFKTTTQPTNLTPFDLGEDVH